MIDPNTPLRIGLLDAFQTLSIPGWAKKVPKNTHPIPLNYYIINTQTLNPTERCKEGFEWLCSVNIDVIYSGPAGYASPVETEDIEGQIITAIEAGITITGFDVKNIRFLSSIDLDEETDTQSIERRVITYQFWLCQV
jgi:hypothetical protein